MKIEDFLSAFLQRVQDSLPEFAICGTFASNLYRNEKQAWPRIDILTRREFFSETQALLDFVPSRLFEAADAVLERQDPRILSYRLDVPDLRDFQVSFWSEEFPWAESALKRANSFRAYVSTGRFPVLTCEDVILSYLYELELLQDNSLALSDLEGIFAAEPEIDLAYLVAEMKRTKVSFPPLLKNVVPAILYRVSRQNDMLQGKRWRSDLAVSVRPPARRKLPASKA